jgi:hypothetical protein
MAGQLPEQVRRAARSIAWLHQKSNLVQYRGAASIAKKIIPIAENITELNNR